MPDYRIEISPNNRAGCTDTVCKKESAKCLKGSLRFGTWTTIMDHESWKWKHWGCVSGEQLAHVRASVESDGKFDYNAFDGYDEMGDHPDLQAKIRDAIKAGHVSAEDFNGDPWMNKAGQRGIRGKKPKDWDDGEDDTPAKGTKRAADDEADEKPKKRTKKAAKAEPEDEEEEKPKPKAKRGKAAAAAKASANDEEEAKPKKRAARKPTVKEASEPEDEEEEAPKPKRAAAKKAAPAPKKAAAKKGKVEESEEETWPESPLTTEEEEEEEEEEPAPKKKAAPKGRKKAAPAAEKPKKAGRARK